MNDTVRTLFESGRHLLRNANVTDADFDAFSICAGVTGIDRTEFLLNPEREVSENEKTRIEKMLNERASGRPLQYVLGEWTFFGRNFAVGEGVLIPRPETEQLVDLCIGEIKKNNFKTVFDLCAGTGCIGITAACECPDTSVYLFELYDEAFSFLENNVSLCPDGRVCAVRRDIFSGVPDGFPAADIIVSNPPYIPNEEMKSLQSEVRREPATALCGGEDGLIFYRAVAEKWISALRVGGVLAVECGEHQSQKIAKMFDEYGIVETVTDFYGVDRFVVLHKK